MATGYVELTFGENDDQIGSNSMRFKAKGGECYRASMAWWPENQDGTLNMDGNTPKFLAANRVYIAGVGYVMIKDPEYVKLAGKEPKPGVSTVIVLWPTDKTGELDKAKFNKGEGLEVLIWTMSKEKYNAIKKIANNGFPFSNFDLSIDCSDTQYQKMSFTPCQENLLKKIFNSPKAKTLGDRLRELIKNAVAALPNELAKDLTIDQIRERLSGQDGAPISPTGAVATQDVDAMIDDILEG